jgi:hypothetical protein
MNDPDPLMAENGEEDASERGRAIRYFEPLAAD